MIRQIARGIALAIYIPAALFLLTVAFLVNAARNLFRK